MSTDADEQAGDDRRKYEFKKVIEELQEYEGSGTQLVTIYIPDDKQISSVVEHVIQEHSEASNIKSKQTRTNVQDALTSIKDRLRYYDTYPPDNGIVIFSGAVDSGGGQTEMVTKVLESPSEPIQSFRYHCDSAFLTEPLENMLLDKGLFGLIVLDRREANVGWLKGKRVEPVKSASSLVPGKQRKGGQSAQRFGEERRIAVIPERLDRLRRRLQHTGDHLGLAAAAVDGAGEDDDPVFGWVGVVVAQPVFDRFESVLDVRPGLFGLDVRCLRVLLYDVIHDRGDLLVVGDVYRDKLGARPLVLLQLLDDLLELVFLTVLAGLLLGVRTHYRHIPRLRVSML